MKQLIPSKKLNNNNFFRLSKSNPSRTRQRPNQIVIEKWRKCTRITQKKKKLKDTHEFKEVYFASDKTAKEMEYYKTVKRELVERKNNGEEDIKIKYLRWYRTKNCEDRFQLSKSR